MKMLLVRILLFYPVKTRIYLPLIVSGKIELLRLLKAKMIILKVFEVTGLKSVELVLFGTWLGIFGSDYVSKCSYF